MYECASFALACNEAVLVYCKLLSPTASVQELAPRNGTPRPQQRVVAVLGGRLDLFLQQAQHVRLMKG